MMPATALLFAASLLAQVRGTTPMTDLLKKHEASSTIQITNNLGYSAGSLSIQLSKDTWQLYYQYRGSTDKDLLRHNKDLEQKSSLVKQQEDESLQVYAERVAQQKNELTQFAQDKIVENVNDGRLPLAGFGATQTMNDALYTNNNSKWRIAGQAWENLEWFAKDQ